MKSPMLFGSKVNKYPQTFVIRFIRIWMQWGEFKWAGWARRYQLKDVLQILYTKWKENKFLSAVTISWEVITMVFLDTLFPIEKREAKVEDLTKLFQEGMTIQEYSLKFSKLCKYALSMVSNFRDEMRHFVTSVSNDLVE